MRPLKILDRYILKNFLGTFVVTELVVLVLATIVDMSEKIDKYLTNQAPASEIATYCLNFALYYGNMYMSLVVFLAATIFTSKFAARSEIIAIMSANPAQSAAENTVESQSAEQTVALAGSTVPSRPPATGPTIDTPWR